MIEKSIMISGFGGQGVLFLGQLLAETGMMEEKNVTWVPSYGPAMRGGTANCTIIVSDVEIGSPVVSYPDTLIAMNGPSLRKFGESVKPEGLIIVNSSIVDFRSIRKDVLTLKISANDIAKKLGNVKVANMVLLGTYLKKTEIVSFITLLETLKKELSRKGRLNLFEVNKKALEAGASEVN